LTARRLVQVEGFPPPPGQDSLRVSSNLVGYRRDIGRARRATRVDPLVALRRE
jgi:hypothetical protein